MVDYVGRDYEWDTDKDEYNRNEHHISFAEARRAFKDRRRVFLEDEKHSFDEQRYFCLGLVDGEVMTVRFTFRENRFRIFGAGYWRWGKKKYREINP